MIITIDGPAGSGKSSVAAMLAQELKLKHLNSGLLYRGFTYFVLKHLTKNVSIDSLIISLEKEIIDPLWLRYFELVDVSFNTTGEMNVFLENKNITSELKSTEIFNIVPYLSKIAEVRNYILFLQRKLANNTNLVVEGRDCGSVVFPNADIKFFLTASLEERTKRITKNMLGQKSNLSFDEIKKMIQARDQKDLSRKDSPLTIPENAIIIDNSNLDVKQTVDQMIVNIQNLK